MSNMNYLFILSKTISVVDKKKVSNSCSKKNFTDYFKLLFTKFF